MAWATFYRFNSYQRVKHMQSNHYTHRLLVGSGNVVGLSLEFSALWNIVSLDVYRISMTIDIDSSVYYIISGPVSLSRSLETKYMQFREYCCNVIKLNYTLNFAQIKYKNLKLNSRILRFQVQERKWQTNLSIVHINCLQGKQYVYKKL